MTTNNFFNIKRFAISLRNDLILNKKNLLYLFGALIFVISVIFFALRIDKSSRPNDFHTVIFAFSYVIIGWFMTAHMFLEFSNKSRAISYMSTPNSHFEKFLSKFLFSTVLYTISYIGFYKFISYSFDQTFTLHEYTGWDFTGLKYFIMLYIFGQSIFMIGATTFNKQALLKTLFSLSIIFVVGFLALYILGTNGYLRVSPRFDEYTIYLKKWNSEYKEIIFYKLFVKTVIYGIPLVLWFISYLKIKEKEV